jgi:lipoyl-dependent peroxiredoxin
MKRRANAVWRGTGLEGQGVLTTGSGALRETPYSLTTRFVSEDGTAGTNPEELLAAAHAGCFNMSLSFRLGAAGHPPVEIETSATLSMEREGVHWTITGIHLELRARVPGIPEAVFLEAAEAAKSTCPVSKVLNAAITLDATLLD